MTLEVQPWGDDAVVLTDRNRRVPSSLQLLPLDYSPILVNATQRLFLFTTIFPASSIASGTKEGGKKKKKHSEHFD